MAIIPRWTALASAEPDARRRSDYAGLALVFAEAAGCSDPWKQALHGWNMKQSQQVLQWQAEERAEALLEVLQLKFGPVPGDLETGIRASTDRGQLKQWLAAAMSSTTLDDFRRMAGV